MSDNLFPIRNMLLKDTYCDKLLLRVIFINSILQEVWLCNILDNSYPFALSLASVLSDMNYPICRYVIVHDDPFLSINNTPNTKNINVSIKDAERYELIKPLISGENELLILYNINRTDLILNRLSQVKSTRQTITATLLRFWKRGMTIDAVRSDYKNCGTRKDKQPRNVTKKLGRPRTISPGTGVNACEIQTQRLLRVAADFWLTDSKHSYSRAIDYVARKYCSTQVLDSNDTVVKILIDHESMFTPKQLRNYINKTCPYPKTIQKRYGKKRFDLEYRKILGSADGDVQGPGDRFEIDATVADIYLTSQLDRNRIVGRPVIYFVVDVFSRLITGLYVGFEGPSWVGAMMALINMVSPKVEFCRQYGINIQEKEWPSHHAPKRIMGDRGELMSNRLGKNITENLRIEIENASPGRGDMKSIVERRFGIVPAKFKQFCPGYVEQDFGERGAKDYRVNAALNLREFTTLVINAVRIHNISPIENYNLPPEMITENLTASPIDLWHWGTINRSGDLSILPMDKVALNVMPTGEGRITAKGILFKQCLYLSEYYNQHHIYDKARHNSSKVSVCYDPRDMGQIYIIDKDLPNEFEICNLVDSSSIYKGVSLFETEELSYTRKRTTALKEESIQETRILIEEQMESIRENALAEKKSSDIGISASQKIKHIRDNKAAEKALNRCTETIYLTDRTANKVNAADTQDESVNTTNAQAHVASMIDLFMNKRIERRLTKNDK